MHEEINTTGKRVGKVLDIAGTRLWVIRKMPSGNIGTFQAYRGMPVHMNDHLKTDKDTIATISFDIGGEAGLGPKTEVVVSGLRDVDLVGSQLDYFLGSIRKSWAKIDKNSSQLQIKSSGGVLGGMEG